MFLKRRSLFFGEKKFFEHYGFKVVDTIGEYELMALQFDNHEISRFNEQARTMKIEQQDLQFIIVMNVLMLNMELKNYQIMLKKIIDN